MEEKEVRMKVAAESEENAKKLKKFTSDQRGGPPVEDSYPDLHEAIVALTSAGAGSDRRRRTEERSVHLIPTSTLSHVDTTKK